MTTLYQQTRKAGIDPNHWYAVARSRALRPGTLTEITFAERSIALFRGSDGSVGAIANSCAHRRIKLTLGNVCGNHVVCAYHGWEYDGSGRLARVPHDLFGREMPAISLRSYPVRERYGIVWIFPGERSKAEETPLPPFPELERERPWVSVELDFVWRAHFSIIVENLLDFTHAYLHRRSRAFEDVVLQRFEGNANRVVADYGASIGNSRVLGSFVNRGRIDTTRISTVFQYPYQRASIGEKIKHWCFLTPIDVRTTKVMFTIVVDFDALRIPGTPIRLPRRGAQLFLDVAKKVMIAGLVREDGRAVEAEQAAVDSIRDARFVELNPVTRLVQEMIVQRWQAFEATGTREAGGRPRASVFAGAEGSS